MLSITVCKDIKFKHVIYAAPVSYFRYLRYIENCSILNSDFLDINLITWRVMVA